MSDLFELAEQQRADEITAAEERRRAAAEERGRERGLEQAWNQACSFDVDSFLALGRLLAANGQADYLPAIAETRRNAVNAGGIDSAAELYIVECLRLACAPATPPGELADKLAKGKELWPDGLGWSMGAIKEYMAIRHQHGGKLPKEPAEPKSASVEPVDMAGVAPRNRWALQQYEARRTVTYHKPAQVWREWQSMTQEARAAICPDSPGLVDKSAIAKGIQRARLARDGKAKRKRTKRGKR